MRRTTAGTLAAPETRAERRAREQVHDLTAQLEAARRAREIAEREARDRVTRARRPGRAALVAQVGDAADRLATTLAALADYDQGTVGAGGERPDAVLAPFRGQWSIERERLGGRAGCPRRD